MLAEVILCLGPSSEHNFGELGAIMTKVMVGVAPPSSITVASWPTLAITHWWPRRVITFTTPLPRITTWLFKA